MTLDLQQIDGLTGGRLGRVDVACPECGPARRSPINRRRKVMRIWRLDPGFATWHCARCGERGHTRDADASPPDRKRLEDARREGEARERQAAAERLILARRLWSQRRPIAGSPVETYLRHVRGYGGTIPATIGYLPPRGEHGAAMIAAFGIPAEPEPGLLAIATEAVLGVHLTRLAPDGRGKAGTEADKIMLGKSLGTPIVLAAVNDLGGLLIGEGVEDVLSAVEASGLGGWAAGAASRMPALAGAIPSYVEVVTLLVDDDDAGRRHGAELANEIAARGVEVRPIQFKQTAAAA